MDWSRCSHRVRSTGMRSFKPEHAFLQVANWYIGTKSLNDPVFWLHSLESSPICLSWLSISMHRSIYQKQDLSLVYQIFSCVSAVLKTDKSAEVRRAAVLLITLILRGLGKSIMEVSLFTNESEDLLFSANQGTSFAWPFPHLSLRPMHNTMYCGLGWRSYMRILFYGSVRSKTFNKENFCYPSNRKR